ncbi:MAG: phage major tail tube protein [Rhodovulum sp.]
MAYPKKIRNFGAFKNGENYIGLVSAGKLPSVKIKTEADTGAGLDGEYAVDMGTEAMQTELTFIEWAPEVITLLGTRDRIVLRPVAKAATDGDDEATGYIFTLGGLNTSLEFDELKPREGATMKITSEVTYFRLEREGEELIKIDVEHAVRVIGGVDQLAALRSKMGF